MTFEKLAEDRDLLESVAEATAATHTVGSVAHNPEGRNQYKNCGE